MWIDLVLALPETAVESQRKIRDAMFCFLSQAERNPVTIFNNKKLRLPLQNTENVIESTFVSHCIALEAKLHFQRITTQVVGWIGNQMPKWEKYIHD